MRVSREPGKGARRSPDRRPDARSRALTDALEQQAATSEILRVISRSPGDAHPVFETIVASAARLCEANFALVTVHDGDRLSLGARTSCTPEFADYLARGFPIDRETASGRAFLDRKPVQVMDFTAEPGIRTTPAHRIEGIRTVLAVPMLRDDRLLGVIAVWRREVRPFTERQISLLQTFADQAVIAIDNARLFTELAVRNRELTEAVEQQTATSEILRVISRSPTDVQPVFDTIVTSATRLCESQFAFVLLNRGGSLALAARTECTPEFAAFLAQGKAANRGSATGRAALQRAPVQILDFLADPEVNVTPAHRAEGVRTVLAVPMLRDDTLLGVIATWRREVRPFSERQISLLRTFADQAVIAIDNARLFTELAARNRELTEAVEQQTATSEILRVISRSPTEVPFETIAAAALKLCGATSANIFTFDGELLHVAAVAITHPGGGAAIRRLFPRPPDRGLAASRAILTRGVVAIHDTYADPEYELKNAEQWGFRSVLAIPLMRDGVPIGVIAVGRREPGPFPGNQIALLQTFADQAVIALENVRLFKTLEARNRELRQAVEQQTATSEILRVISRSPTEVPFDTIVATARRLCEASAANMFTFDGELLHVAALAMDNPEGVAALHRHFPRPPNRGMAASRAVLSRRMVTIHDTTSDPEYEWANAERWGFRSVVCIPLMREGTPIGAIAIGRREPGPFPHKQIALLQTFADQAVIALENVRLFKALEARTTELARSVEQLRALSEVGQAVSSTLDLETVLSTIVSRATELASMEGGAIYEYEEGPKEFRLHATDGLPEELVDALRSAPIPKGEGAVGRLATTGEPVTISDIRDARMYQSRAREILLRLGYRSLLAVPLLREDRLLGGLVVNRKSPGAFDSQVIDLLKTFATQSALAIQNARLYREIEEKSRQLEIASRHKSAFLANMSHELRTPLNAIIGFSRIVMRRSQERLEPKQYENMEKILASAQHLLSLINAVLDLAKVEAGRIEVHPEEVQLATVLEQCMRTVEPLMKSAVTQVREIDRELPQMWVDEEKLRQIVMNLLSNAAKYTSSGTIQVRARSANGSIELAVADTGIGIAADKLDVIFEEFEQADPRNTRGYGGTGLGLAIARRLARLMGGDIHADSTLGAGSTFTLTLPIRYGSPPSP